MLGWLADVAEMQPDFGTPGAVREFLEVSIRVLVVDRSVHSFTHNLSNFPGPKMSSGPTATPGTGEGVGGRG